MNKNESEEPPSSAGIRSPFEMGAPPGRFENSGTVTIHQPPAQKFLRAMAQAAAQPETTTESAPHLEFTHLRWVRFENCKRLDLLESRNKENLTNIKTAFDAIIESEFKIMVDEETGKKKSSIGRPGGNPEYGWTYLAPLEASSAGAHTYPEKKYRGSLFVNMEVCCKPEVLDRTFAKIGAYVEAESMKILVSVDEPLSEKEPQEALPARA